MAQMDACVSEADSGQGGGQEHLRLGVPIGLDGGQREVVDGVLQGAEGEDVRDGVGALIGGAVERVGWARGALRVGDRGPGFKRVA